MCFGGSTGSTLATIGAVAAAPFTGGSSLAIAAQLAGAGLAAYGAASAASAQKKQAEYSAKVNAANAAQAQINANDALQRGAIAEMQQRQRTAQTLSAQRGAMAANNLEIAEGTSAVDVLGDTAAMGELDALTIRENARRESNNYLQQASNYTSQGLMDTATANQSNPWMAAGTSLGDSLVQVAPKWYEWSKENKNTATKA